MPIIETRDLSKHFKVLNRRKGFWAFFLDLFSRDFRQIKAVDGVNISIEEGELVGYIGPNGAGKSTTIKMLSGILHPSGGSVVVDGIVPFRDRIANARKIAVVFGQRSQLLWDLPVNDSFILMRKLYAIPKERWEENVRQFTQLLDLAEFINRPVRTLSLGQRMRCELAASLLHDPKIVYLDEPTIGLDLVAKDRIREFILNLCRERKTTVLLTTHDIGDIERLCQRVVIIDKGKVLYDGSLAEIKRRYCHLRRVVFSLVAGSEPAGLDEALRSIDASVKVDRRDNGNIEVSFDPGQVAVSEVTRQVVNHYQVSDLAVEETDLEAIIREIYLDGMK